MNRHRRCFRPRTEWLDDRCTPVTWGSPWPTAQALSLSFAPDLTRIGTEPSTLFRELDSLNSGAQDWQLEILRAFQTWAVHGNINIAVTGDQGQEFGTPGSLQGDPRFGDIRIGAVPQSDGNLMQNQPFSYIAGTWAGDVYLNSDMPFGIRQPETFDLYSAMLNEAGNVLGLQDTRSDQTSALFYAYLGLRTGPNSDDIAKLQSLYGPRQPDAYEGALGNDTFGRAVSITPVNLLGTNAGSPNVTVKADVTSLSDRDFYKFTTSALSGPVYVQVRTTGVSSLAAKLTVYNSAKQPIGTVTATDPRSGDLSFRIDNVGLFGSTFYVSVESGSDDVFGIGGYQLRTIPLLTQTLENLPWVLDSLTNGILELEQGLNDTLSTATNLIIRPPSFGAFDYNAAGSLLTALDVDYYTVTAPPAQGGASGSVMTVSVWGTTLLSPDAKVTVLDTANRPLDAKVLLHQGNTYTVQIPNATPGTKYAVRVEAYDRGNLLTLGNYALGVDFGPQSENLTTFLNGTLAPSSNGSWSAQPGLGVNVREDRLFHFLLSADNGGAVQNTSAKLTIYDAAGRVVKTLTTRSNQAQSFQVTLPRGSYSFRITGLGSAGSATVPIRWIIQGADISGPVKPYPSDPTDDPSGGTSDGNAGGGTAPGGTVANEGPFDTTVLPA